MKLFAAALAVSLTAGSIHAQTTIRDENVTIPMELAFSSRSLSKRERPAVSPDGRFVVYAVDEPVLRRGQKTAGTKTNAAGIRLFLTDVTNGTTHALSKEATNSRRPSFSPDGSKIAYYSDEDGFLALWIYDITKGAARKVVNKYVVINERLYDDAAWTPDGKEVLFGYVHIADGRELALEDKQSAMRPKVYQSEAPPPVDEGPKPPSGYYPSFDGRQIAFVNIENGNVRNLGGTGTAPPARARLSVSGRFVSFDSGYRPTTSADEPLARDLVVCDAASGAVLFTEPNYTFDDSGELYEAHQWHPKDDRLFYFSNKHLTVRDFTNGTPGPEKLYGEGLGDADPRFLYFTRDFGYVIFSIVQNGPPEDGRLGVQALVCVELATGIVTALSFPENTRIVNLFCAQPGIAWQPEKGKLAAVARDLQNGLSSFVEIDIETGGITKRMAGTFRAASAGSGANHNNLLIQFENAQSNSDIYQISRDFNISKIDALKRITKIEPRYDGLALANVETFSTRVIAPDGTPRTVYSSILLPAGRSKDTKLPVIVSIYGGERRSIEAELFGGGNVASIPAPLFTSRGFAILFADSLMDPRGKPGNPTQNLKEIILPQIVHAAELGFIDMDRVGVAGDGYGGYSVASLLSATPFFKAGAAVSGIYDLASHNFSEPSDMFRKRSRWAESGEGRMGVHVWADGKRYFDHSPFFQADKITTPLLMIHGGADREHPAAEAHKMFEALSRLEKTAELAIYPGEDHWIPNWSFDNSGDAAQRMLTFFGKYLKGD